ncbi:MAG: cobalamin B12-binding domain-containing protein [Isosphaeraceae bacterium]
MDRHEEPSPIATPEGLRRFLSLQDDAVEAVVGRFDQISPASYGTFGERGRAACREDIGYHLEFLRPALEFGILQPFVDYVRWLAVVLETRGIPAEHLTLSLDWLTEFFTARLPGEDAEPVVVALNAARTALRDPSNYVPPYERFMPESCGECDAFEAALVRGDQRTTVNIFREVARHGQGFLDAELHLVQPALYRIGRGWQDNRISVAQEHLATAMVNSLLAREFAFEKPEPPNDRSVVLAGVEGNQHAVGLRVVADGLELAGWDVRYLGADTPTRSLVQLVRDERPNLVGLSASMPHHLRSAREAIACLRDELDEARPAVLLGGLAINQFSPLATMLGADATGPDARSAMEAAAQLVSSP